MPVNLNVRPPLLIVGALVAGVLAAPWLALPPLVLCGAMALCVGAALLLARRPAAMLISLLLCVALFGVLRARSAAAPALDDVSRYAGSASIWVRGRIASDIEDAPHGARFVLAAQAVDDYAAMRPASGLTRVTVRPADAARRIRAGDLVWLRGRVAVPLGATNPGGFDYAAFLARRGVWSTLTVRRADDLRRAGAGGLAETPRRAAAWLRNRVRAATQTHLDPDAAALLDGLLLGMRGRIPADVEDAFARTGTVHILSTSGLHLTILAAFFAAAFGLLSAPRPLAGVVCIGLLWVYALAAGMGPAVTRSALMLSIVLLAPLVRRSADPLNALAVAGFVILLHSPLAIYDAGTQLSFATVATLLAWMPFLERTLFPWEPGLGRLRQLGRGVLGAIAVACVAQAGSWPLVAWHYNLFSCVAPLANPPIVALAGGLLLGGLVAVALSPVPWLGALFWPLLGGGLHLLGALILWLAHLPGAAVSVSPPSPLLVFTYYLLLWGAAPLANRYALRKTLFAPGAPAAANPDGGAGRGVAVAPS